MIEHLGGLSYKDGLVCWSTINMIFCGDLEGSKLRNVFKLLPNGATLGICAGNNILQHVLPIQRFSELCFHRH